MIITLQLQLHYITIMCVMTKKHMDLSIDVNDDLKENQQLQLQSQSQSHYNYNHINVHKHQPYVNGTLR